MAKAYPQPEQGKGIAREEGGKAAPAGLWRHPESGQEAITIEDELFGNAMSQGFKRMGFVYVRPADPAEIKTMPQLAAEGREADENNMKGLSARLTMLEGAARENVALEAEVKALRAEKQAREEADAAAAEKAAKVDDEEADKSGSEEDVDKPVLSDKSLKEQNESELRATAAAEGVELTDGHTTKGLIREAIQAARDAKEEE